MKQLIACCGFDCENCDVRMATLADDDAMRKAAVSRWSAGGNEPGIAIEMINCLGCRTEGVKFGYCSACEIRSCAMGHGFETCGECSELTACRTIAPVLEHAPKTR